MKEWWETIFQKQDLNILCILHKQQDFQLPWQAMLPLWGRDSYDYVGVAVGGLNTSHVCPL